MIGCNLNAITNKKLNMLLKLLYKQVDQFRVRDSNSVKILNKDYNINEAFISLKPDLADKSKLSLTVTKEDSCAVSIINNKNTNKTKYYDWLTSNFKELRKKEYIISNYLVSILGQSQMKNQLMIFLY